MTDTPPGTAPGAAGTNSANAANASGVSGAANAASPGRAPDGVLAMLKSVWRDLPGLFNDRVELLSLELQRAGLALVQIVMLLVIVAILGVTVWLVLWGAIIVALVALGLHLALALLVALVLNALAAALALSRVRSLLPMLKFPATRRHLTFSPSTEPPPPPEPTTP